MNPVSIESHLRNILLGWGIIMVAAWLAGRGARRLGQPAAVGEIAMGLLLGPSGLGLVWPGAMEALFPASAQQSFQLLAKLGLILLMFQVGMEFDFSHVRHRSRAITAISLAGMVAPMLCGLAIGPWLHRNFSPDTPWLDFQLFVCLALSISALPIMGRMLMEWGLARAPMAVVALSSAAIDDAAGWFLLAGATAAVTSGFEWSRAAVQLGGLGLLMLLIAGVLGPALQRAWAREVNSGEPSRLSSGMFLRLFAAILLCAWATNCLGLFSIFGAFLLGVSLHRELALAAAWREALGPLVLVALVPVFFMYTGLRTEVGSLSGGQAWMGCVAVLAMAVLGKMGGCWLGARWAGLPAREAAFVAALMNTRAMMGLVVINIGYELGLLNRELFTMFVIMALVTTVMTGPLVRRWHPEGTIYLDERSRGGHPVSSGQ